MVTSYYIMKFSENKNRFDSYDYFSNLFETPVPTELCDKNGSKCRVCLQVGTVSISEVEDASEIKQSLQIFHIKVTDENTYSKYLCKMCYIFLKSVIVFRKIVEKTNNILYRRNKSTDLVNVECLSKCNDSEEVVTHEQELDKNMQLKNKRKGRNVNTSRIPCPICKKLLSPSYYRRHLQIHNPNSEKHACDICGKTFRLGPGYYNHRLRHRSDYPYKCQLCPYKGKYLGRLNSHLRSHAADYKYMCTKCPARFIFKSNFNRHVLFKHSEPQYKCDKCTKTFYLKIELQRHNDVAHLGLRNHLCNICGRAFGHKTSMHKHQRKVHKRENLRFYFKPLEKDNTVS